MECLRFFQSIEVFPLYVFNNGHFQKIWVSYIFYNSGHMGEPCHFSCAKPSFTGYQLITVSVFSKQDRLYDSLLFNWGTKLFKNLLRKIYTRLIPVGMDQIDIALEIINLLVFKSSKIRNKSIKTSSKCHFFPFF